MTVDMLKNIKNDGSTLGRLSDLVKDNGLRLLCGIDSSLCVGYNSSQRGYFMGACKVSRDVDSSFYLFSYPVACSSFFEVGGESVSRFNSIGWDTTKSLDGSSYVMRGSGLRLLYSNMYASFSQERLLEVRDVYRDVFGDGLELGFYFYNDGVSDVVYGSFYLKLPNC